MQVKHYYIINPVAGDGSHKKRLKDEIQKVYKDGDIPYSIYYTKNRGDVKRYAKTIDTSVSCRVYACGGDGTVNEALNGLTDLTNVEFGIIPCGSGNDFVKNIAENELLLDIKNQRDGTATTVDYIETSEGRALNICNMGLDALVAFNFDKFKNTKVLGGNRAYTASIPYSMMSKLGWNITVTIDDKETLDLDSLIVVVGNGFCYGSKYNGAPKAICNNGLLDLVAIDTISRLKIAGMLKKFEKGEHLDDPKISKICTYRRGRKFSIKSEREIYLCLDGETMMVNDVEISVVPAGLKFILPDLCSITSFAD